MDRHKGTDLFLGRRAKTLQVRSGGSGTSKVFGAGRRTCA